MCNNHHHESVGGGTNNSSNTSTSSLNTTTSSHSTSAANNNNNNTMEDSTMKLVQHQHTHLHPHSSAQAAAATTANFSRPSGSNRNSSRVVDRKRVTFRDQQQALFGSSSCSSTSSSSDDSSSSSSDNDSTTNEDDDDDHHRTLPTPSVTATTTAVIDAATSHMSKEELKAICWYSDEELKVSRQDAKETIQALQRGEHAMMMITTTKEGDQQDDGDDDDDSATTTATPRSFCWRGVEKYVDAVGKLEQQRRLVGSVLHQQSIGGPIGSKEDHVAIVSRTLSQPFKDLARHYAEECAQELRLELHQERQEMERIKYRLHQLQQNPTTNREQQQQQPQTDSLSSMSVGQKRSQSSSSGAHKGNGDCSFVSSLISTSIFSMSTSFVLAVEASFDDNDVERDTSNAVWLLLSVMFKSMS